MKFLLLIVTIISGCASAPTPDKAPNPGGEPSEPIEAPVAQAERVNPPTTSSVPAPEPGSSDSELDANARFEEMLKVQKRFLAAPLPITPITSQAQVEAVKNKASLLKELQVACEQVADTKDIALASEAAFKLAQSYEIFGAELEALPPVQGLTDPAQVWLYQQELKREAEPVYEVAVGHYDTALRLAEDLNEGWMDEAKASKERVLKRLEQIDQSLRSP